MLKIWGRKNSSNVRKALWCAEELGLDYEAIDAGGAFGVVDTPQYRALNPNGRVPMIEDGDFVLWESNTIVRYLCAKQGSSWYPTDLKARASAEKWMDWTTSTLAEPFKIVFWGILRTPAEKQNWDNIHAGRKACIEALSTVEKALAEQPVSVGQRDRHGRYPPGLFCLRLV